MSEVILPQEAQYAAELARSLQKVDRVRQRGDYLKWFDRELRQIDGCLSLVRASENSTAPGMIAGYWHVMRDNPRTMPAFFPIRGPNGEFMETENSWNPTAAS
jgi:hypothetical protein